MLDTDDTRFGGKGGRTEARLVSRRRALPCGVGAIGGLHVQALRVRLPPLSACAVDVAVLGLPSMHCRLSSSSGSDDD